MCMHDFIYIYIYIIYLLWFFSPFHLSTCGKGFLPSQSKGWLSGEYSPPARYFSHLKYCAFRVKERDGGKEISSNCRNVACVVINVPCDRKQLVKQSIGLLFHQLARSALKVTTRKF